MRLSDATVGGVVGAEPPRYDRSRPARIAHLGVGAFARAHLAVYADDVLRSGGGDAAVQGISLRSPDAERALAPQDGWFSVTTREPGQPTARRVVGSLTSVRTGAAAAVDAVANGATSLVTLTITEKGYQPGAPSPSPSPSPSSAPAVLAAALAERRAGSGAPVVVASLDNLLDNGRVLARLVRDEAALLDASLARWIDEHVAFPRSVVDRMVPATTAADLDEVHHALGLEDRGAVVAEAHRSWVLETPGGAGAALVEELGLGAAGVELVEDAGWHQQRKLWLLNGPHSAAAYAGLLARHDTIAGAVANPRVDAFVRRIVDDVLDVLSPPGATGPDLKAFAASSLRRFANPALGHRCDQVGADGSRKLAQRLLPVLRRRRELGLPNARGAMVLALWIAAVASLPVPGGALAPVADPAAEELRAVAASGDRAPLVATALGHVGAGDESSAEHEHEVRAALERILRDGVGALEVDG